MDMINRQAAINALICKMRPHDNGDGTMTIYAMSERLVRETLNNLPSVQPEQQWIPCSERLPHGSCSDLVNVSIHNDSGDTPYDYTSCGWITTDGEDWIVDNEINNHVVAWMPLPEPYKKGKE